ncbi:MAG: hypothetical protein PWQ88_82 [Candidatus Methanomethylophilaceae archaeon]|nr:hypothetical protein [Candidatus Methanomethylophilaceae archaeon]MDI3541777.1 hypothetical protein [Candidatus Methanomethylophilaceae archaeon]HIJ00730.1 HD domain-containing protein [Candidatus Methanomethylophilaceae archaeon]
MTSLNIELVHQFFQAAHMRRWNDHLRPVELIELDKQAHKAVIAWVLGKFEESEGRHNKPLDWKTIIEGGMFEFLQRVILTDLKPPVFHRIEKQRGKELQDFVLNELHKIKGIDEDFLRCFEEHFNKDPNSLERRILNAAHYLATDWEFKIIYAANPYMYGIEETKREIELQIEDHYDLIGVQRILLEKKSFGFIDFCGQLRFQHRWARSPRVPDTSVLGHSLMVAQMTLLLSRSLGDCERRVYNNYYTALFHDLPEVLTKDIISPIKRNIGGLQEILDGYERELVEERLLPLLPSTWHDDLRYLLYEQGKNKYVCKGKTIVTEEDIPFEFNDNDANPRDGRMVKMCDILSAYHEAWASKCHGITSKTLREALGEMKNQMNDMSTRGIDAGKLIDLIENIDV